MAYSFFPVVASDQSGMNIVSVVSEAYAINLPPDREQRMKKSGIISIAGVIFHYYRKHFGMRQTQSSSFRKLFVSVPKGSTVFQMIPFE
ncbi:hypothetical protein SCA6_004095 [Theobroma cacao]